MTQESNLLTLDTSDIHTDTKVEEERPASAPTTVDAAAPSQGETSVVVNINKLLLEKISQLERENKMLKEENATLKGKKLTYGPIRRHPSLKPSDPLYSTPYDGCYTLNDCWKRAVSKFKNEKCMGYRVLVRTHTEQKTLPDGTTRDWEIPEYENAMRWITYNGVSEMVFYIGSGLVQWANLGWSDRVGIHMDTRREWMQTALSCFDHGMVVVTCYANLGEDALIHVINQTELTTMVTDVKLVPILDKIAPSCPTLKKVIFVGSATCPHETDRFEMISFGELVKKGRSNRVRPFRPPSREDMAVLMYTSGSTGQPKGICLSHRNLVASCGAVREALPMSQSDCYIGYLPLAHCFELVCELGSLLFGVRVGYATARTLTDENAKPFGDLRAINPTIMAGVPRVYETIRKGILDKVKKGNLIKRKLFDVAFPKRLEALKKGSDTPMLNKLVFNRLKEKIGVPNIRVLVSGGAPLSAETHMFLHCCFGCSVIQGIGLTETSSLVAAQDPYRPIKTLNVGYPVKCTEVRLMDVPDMGYFHSDNPSRGEVCVRGPNIFGGYFKRPDLTKEAFVDGGWFRTGDVGEWDTDGTLKIIDRIKNLVKLSLGEYVALESLEMIYNLSDFVAPNGICIYGDSYQDCIVAIIQPRQSYIVEWAKENQIEDDIVDSLYENESLKEAIVDDLRRIAEEQGKKKFEQVAAVHLSSEEFTPENGLTTASFKLNRNAIYKRFKSEIDSMYEKLKTVE